MNEISLSEVIGILVEVLRLPFARIDMEGKDHKVLYIPCHSLLNHERGYLAAYVRRNAGVVPDGAAGAVLAEKLSSGLIKVTPD